MSIPNENGFRANMDANMRSRVESVKQLIRDDQKLVLQLLMDNFETSQNSTTIEELGFSKVALGKEYDGKSEQDLINFCENDLQVSTNELAKNGAAIEAKRLYRQSKSVTAKGTERVKTSSFIVQRRIDELVKGQMAKNVDNIGDWAMQRFINSGFIQKGGIEDEFGRSAIENIFNYKATKTYLDSHRQEIDGHHEQLGLQRSHNMKISRELKRRSSEESSESSE